VIHNIKPTTAAGAVFWIQTGHAMSAGGGLANRNKVFGQFLGRGKEEQMD
jgi:hypothetical protein